MAGIVRLCGGGLLGPGCFHRAIVARLCGGRRRGAGLLWEGVLVEGMDDA